MNKLIILFVFLIFNSSLLFINSFAQWQPDVRLTNDPAASWTYDNNASRCIASSGDSVHVVWWDDRDGNKEIYYKRSTNGGVNWGTDTRLTNFPGNSWFQTIALSGSIVHVAWEEKRDGNDEIYYKRSSDGGSSWGVDTRLTYNDSNSWSPSLAVSDLDLHIVWQEYRDGNPEIYYKHSSDGGSSWSADMRLTDNYSFSSYASVAVSGTTVHVAWQDYRYGGAVILYKRSTNAGITWGAENMLANSTAGMYWPSVAVYGQIIHVVWPDSRDGNYEIYYKRSSDGGIIWGANIRLTNDPAYSWFPNVAVSGLVVHVVWEDSRNGGNNNEIYYKHSTNAGISWEDETRLTDNPFLSLGPFISISASTVHVVWSDNRDGNREIYYKRNPTGNITETENISSEIPEQFSLSQNYPNPFNPVTKIRFSLPFYMEGIVILKVFDLLGWEITTLVNEQLLPGTYSVDFDGTNFSSGIYFYSLQTDGYYEVKKMSLIK